MEDYGRRFFVYILLDPREPGLWEYGGRELLFRPFYVGKGCQYRDRVHKTPSSRKEKNLKNNFINKIIAETGDFHLSERIFVNLTEGESKNIEQSVINYFGRITQKDGILTNILGKYDIRKNDIFFEKGKKIYSFNSELKLVKEFLSSRHAAIELKTSTQRLNKAINNFGQYSIDGFYFAISKDAPEIAPPIFKPIRTGRDFELISPTGELIKGNNLQQFAKSIGVASSNLHVLLEGGLGSCLGYKSTNPEFWREKKSYRILSPDKELYEFDEIKFFADKMGLNCKILNRVLLNKVSHAEGFHLENPLEKFKKAIDLSIRGYKLLNLETKTIYQFFYIAPFATKFNISVSRLRRPLLQNKEVNIPGWRSPTLEECENLPTILESRKTNL